MKLPAVEQKRHKKERTRRRIKRSRKNGARTNLTHLPRNSSDKMLKPTKRKTASVYPKRAKARASEAVSERERASERGKNQEKMPKGEEEQINATSSREEANKKRKEYIHSYVFIRSMDDNVCISSAVDTLGYVRPSVHSSSMYQHGYILYTYLHTNSINENETKTNVKIANHIGTLDDMLDILADRIN